MKPCRILSIDGGGSKGSITLGFLIEIEKTLKKPIHELFDLFVGTSAGSIIVSSITLKDSDGNPKFNSCEEILDVFIQNIDKIFYQSWYQMFTTFNGLIGPKYDSRSEEQVLRNIFGNSAISDNVLITANIIDPQVEYFEFNSSVNVPIVDAIMASSAAPTYYGVHTLKYCDKNIDFVDGGISANNPSVAGYAEAIKRGYTTENIILVSIGTGYTNSHNSNLCDEGGMLQWAAPISENMMTTVSDYADHQLLKILTNNNYFRLNMLIASDKMDITDKKILYSMANSVPEFINNNETLKTMFTSACAAINI